MSPMSGTGHVIDDFIDTHPDEAYPRRQWSSGLLDLGAKKNGNAPNLPLPINWQPGVIGRHKNPTLKSGARAS